MATATAPAALKPFTIGSRFSARASFETGQKSLGTGVTPIGPQTVPAVGFLSGLLLHVKATATGGTTPALQPDAPWNIINQIGFRNAKGDNLITPLSGYQLYLINKWGGQNPVGQGAVLDPKNGPGYTSTATAPEFFLWLPLSIDVSQALGVVPATAANNSYQVEIIFSPISTVWTGTPSAATVEVSASAFYYDIPAEGGAFESIPPGLGTASLWSVENPPVTPGEKIIQSQNVGNILRNHIFVTRNASGARVDSDFPAVFTTVVDNVDRLRFDKKAWEFLMRSWYGFTNSSKDAAGGLDTGVYVLPWHLLAGGVAGSPTNTRDQLLQTGTGTQLQFRGQSFGATASTLEIISQSISTTDLNALYNKE